MIVAANVSSRTDSQTAAADGADRVLTNAATMAWLALVAALTLAGWMMAKGDTGNAGAFFGAGALVLVGGPIVLSQIAGAAAVIAGDQRLALRPGHSCLLPASTGEVLLEPQERCALLKAYVPDLLQDIVAPLRESGVPDEAIAALGGQTRLNPLRELVGLA